MSARSREMALLFASADLARCVFVSVYRWYNGGERESERERISRKRSGVCSTDLCAVVVAAYILALLW